MRSVPSRVESFPPIAGRGARALVLGSMPGKASLLAGQYYAHPRNAFWPILGALLTDDADLASRPYGARVRIVRARGLAVWDVLASCTRPGSLDADIDDASIVPNDFAAFFAKHPGVRRVFFNGAKAEATFRRHVLPTLDDDGARRYERLPSTSPAHAAMSFAQKLDAWRALLDALD